MKIKKGDNVIILSGKDKGKKSKVIRAFPDIEKVIVEGVNIVKKHQKPQKQGQKGEIVERAMPMHVSNVSLYSKDGKPSRIRMEIKDGKKVRVLKKSGEKI